jgi:hypothetical protein
MTTCTTTQEQPTEVIVAANDQALPGNLDSIEVSNGDRIPDSPAALHSAIPSAVEPAFDSISATQVSCAKYASVNRVTPKPLSWIVSARRLARRRRDYEPESEESAGSPERSETEKAPSGVYESGHIGCCCPGRQWRSGNEGVVRDERAPGV